MRQMPCSDDNYRAQSPPACQHARWTTEGTIPVAGSMP